MEVIKKIINKLFNTEKASHQSIIKLSTFVVKLSGFNILNDGPIWWFITSFAISCSVLKITQIIFYLILVDRKDMVLGVGLINTYLMYIVTMIYCRSNPEKFKNLLNVQEYWSIDHVDAETEEAQKKIYKYVNFFAKIPIFLGFMSLIISNLSYWFMNNNPLDYYYHFYDVSKSPTYEIDLICMQFTLFCLTSIFVGLQTLTVGSLAFIYCQMIMLKRSLQVSDKKIEDEHSFYVSIIKHMKYYSKIIRYFEEVNDAVSIPFLVLLAVQLVTSGIQFYDTIKQINTNSFSLYYILHSVMDASGYLTFLTIICYITTTVIDEMKSMGDAIYNTEWTNYLSQRIKCAVTIIIMRAHKGVDFKCGKIINVNMNLCTSSFQFIYSLYTLFTTIRK